MNDDHQANADVIGLTSEMSPCRKYRTMCLLLFGKELIMAAPKRDGHNFLNISHYFSLHINSKKSISLMYCTSEKTGNGYVF
jgi:hypothetical protein